MSGSSATWARDGVIRIGGNVSDFALYDANGTSKWEPKDTVITLANIRALRGFLDVTGWKLIWGLNLGGDKLDNAVEEAKAVASVMEGKLLAFECGNEPDLFTRAGHRSGNYDYQAWARDYRRYKSAVRAVLPKAPFAGPDIAFRTEWLESFARDEGADIAMLTSHHYIMGQDNPATTIAFMLAEEKKFQPALAKFQAAAEAAHVPWRMCETQSFSGGGRAGVSDTFASALWALDYLFVLAGYGCSGVNMETGVNHLGRVSKYTPITGELPGPYAPAPEYYGLLAFARAAKGEQIAASTASGGINLTAYATRQGHDTVVTVINKDMTQDASVEIAGIAPKHAQVMRLTATSLAAHPCASPAARRCWTCPPAAPLWSLSQSSAGASSATSVSRRSPRRRRNIPAVMQGLMQHRPLLLSSILEHAARHHGDGEVVSRRADGALSRTTYAALARRARKLAQALRDLGVQPGDRVGTIAMNSDRHLELYYAISGIGAVCNTINPRLAAGRCRLHHGSCPGWRVVRGSRLPAYRPAGRAPADGPSARRGGAGRCPGPTSRCRQPSRFIAMRHCWLGRARSKPGRRSTKTPPRASATPPAPPDAPRACSIPTAPTCCTPWR